MRAGESSLTADFHVDGLSLLVGPPAVGAQFISITRWKEFMKADCPFCVPYPVSLQDYTAIVTVYSIVIAYNWIMWTTHSFIFTFECIAVYATAVRAVSFLRCCLKQRGTSWRYSFFARSYHDFNFNNCSKKLSASLPWARMTFTSTSIPPHRRGSRVHGIRAGIYSQKISYFFHCFLSNRTGYSLIISFQLILSRILA
jgi:hypothetical protein